MSDLETLIERLSLQPHPEGGHYRETFRSERTDASGRSMGTAILYLLGGGDVSRFHRIDADELWFFHQGDPLTVYTLLPDGRMRSDVVSVDSPQLLVPKGVWFGAALDDARGHALVSCTVTPGFEFDGFELAEREALLEGWPDAADWIDRLN
ncbi:MAG: cupin domain-containing protein [Pseudomonadota bacterium]